MKTSSAKGKGRNLQKWLSQMWTEVFGLEEDDVQSRPMGSAGVDLIMSPKAKRLIKISPECKNTKSFPSLSALKQSQANKYEGTIAGVVWKPFGKGMEESIIYFNAREFSEWLQNEIN